MKKFLSKNYETFDLNLAAYLIAAGFCHLKRIDGQSGWKKTFVVSPEPSEEEISGFYNGTGEVQALELCNQLRSLKAASKINGGELCKYV